MPTLKRVVASDGERDKNIGLYGRLKHLKKATGTGQCAAGSNALLCASERGARYRCVVGSQHYSFGEGLTGSRHLHHLAACRGGRVAGRLAGPGKRGAGSRRGVSGTGRGAHAMGCCPEGLSPFRAPWGRPWPVPRLTGFGKTARMAYFRALIWLNLLGNVL